MLDASTGDHKPARLLLRVAGFAETFTGLSFLLFPSVPMRLLFGQMPGGALADLTARILGTTIIALGLASSLMAADAKGRAATAVVASLLFYYAVTAALLAYARFALHMSGIGMWPAVAAHIVMAAWCVRTLSRGT